ncbi:MAG: DUF6599 family protein [Candidatus Eisenbacteria bacterium]
MPDSSTREAQDRLFVRKGRRHYRRSYSSTEWRIGVAVCAGLLGLLTWVAWKGAHPAPDLFRTEVPLLEPKSQPIDGSDGGDALVGTGSRSPAEDAAGGEPSGRNHPEGAVDRGPVPLGIAGNGWTEGPISQFGYDNVYEKIDGREGFYKSFGFRELHFVSMTKDDDPNSIVDLELFDLGDGANALGAYAGERSPDISPDVTDTGMAHIDRNALFLTRGRFYARAIGSDETPAIRSQLEHLRGVLESSLEGEALPWGYGLFVGTLGFGSERVSYLPENAFSFGFATNVYAGLLDDEETELFVTVRDTSEDAASLAEQFRDGFAGYGSPVGESGGVAWIEDRYIQTIAGATSSDRWVIGVRGAPDLETAERGIERLQHAVANRPAPAIRSAGGTEAGESQGRGDGEGH